MNEWDAKARIVELTNVSRETMMWLEQYAALLERWNPKINLVSKSTMGEKWRRHFLDSAQLWPHIPQEAEILTDIGSGAGFAGLVLATIAAEQRPRLKVQLIESDARKCAFLRNTARELGLAVDIHTARIEAAEIPRADVVTARALAPLTELLEFTPKILAENGVCLFLKGEAYGSEVERARESWDFDAQTYPSAAHPLGVLAIISGIRHGK